MITELNKALNDLKVFLEVHGSGYNINYFISTLQEMMDLLKECPVTDEKKKLLRNLYKSMFFPRDGLSDFYVFNQDAILMKKYNVQYSKLLKNIDRLLDFGSF